MCIGTVIVLAVVQLLQSKMRQTHRAVSPPLLAVLLLRARKPIQTAGENTCSQKRASCLGNSRREREAFSSMLSAARSTREARYEQMCHLLSHQRRLENETPAMRRGKHIAQDHLRLRRGKHILLKASLAVHTDSQTRCLPTR